MVKIKIKNALEDKPKILIGGLKWKITLTK
jgi:hypothetical protein